jgi:hypothetical protein
MIFSRAALRVISTITSRTDIGRASRDVSSESLARRTTVEVYDHCERVHAHRDTRPGLHGNGPGAGERDSDCGAVIRALLGRV